MHYCNKFKHTPREQLHVDLTLKGDDNGGYVLIESTNPFVGLTVESFKPINVLRAGGQLKPSPKTPNESIDALDRTISRIEGLKAKNDAIIAEAERLRAIRESYATPVEQTKTEE